MYKAAKQRSQRERKIFIDDLQPVPELLRFLGIDIEPSKTISANNLSLDKIALFKCLDCPEKSISQEELAQHFENQQEEENLVT